MKPKSPSVVLVEFNELTPRLMSQFMGAGHLPNFKRLYDESRVYVTDAEEQGENLNPWVQWVTIHSGLAAAEHGITQLADGHRLQTKAVWDILSEAGHSVWVCGSMNARYDQPLNGYLLPDPWSTGLRPFPENEFSAYYKFVRSSVQEHTDRTAPLSKADAVRFLAFMASHGLSPTTVAMTLKQIWTERVSGQSHWKRAALLDRFQWDVFRHYYRRLRPDFSTFFINSTAHFQHTYWREFEPQLFEVKPSDADQRDHAGAILYGYKNMDDLLGRIMRLAGDDATLIYCTGLSQQPYLKHESAGARHYYRIKSPALLTERLGVRHRHTYHPVMAEQFCLRFDSASDAADSLAELRKHRVGARCAFHGEIHGNDLTVQCSQTSHLPSDTVITVEPDNRTIPFFDVFYETGAVKSGYHHPDGMMWVRSPDRKHEIHEEKVSLKSIAPTVLKMFALPCPEYMRAEPLTRIRDRVAVH